MELGLVVIPVRGIVVNVVGIPRHLVDPRGEAVDDTNIGRWVRAIVGLPDHRSVGDHITNAVGVEISRDQRIVKTGYAGADHIRRIEVGKVERGYGSQWRIVAWVKIQIHPTLSGSGCDKEIGENFQINGIHFRSVRVAIDV